MPLQPPEALREISERIWPGSHLSDKAGTGAFSVLPNASDARFLLPTDPRLARVALRTRTAPRRGTERWRNELLGLALRWGGRRFLVRDYVVPDGRSILDHLADVLGTDLTAVVHLGPPRSNRKPVLTLIGPGNDVVAYAKVGVNALTSSLVRRESDALERLAGLPHRGVRIPKVLDRSRWEGLDVLVLEALRLRTKALSVDDLAATARTLAAATGTGTRPLGAIAADLLVTQQAIDAPGSEEVGDFLRALQDSSGQQDIVCGGWHGDFAPGNVAGSSDGDVAVLDLERYEPSGVPLGSDLLHYRIRWLADVRRTGMTRAVEQVARDVDALLSSTPVAGGTARSVLRLHVARLALRYLSDGQPIVTDPATSIRPWLAATLG